MKLHLSRKAQAWALLILLLTPLAALAGWGAYLRSPWYRQKVEGRLQSALGLKVRVGWVEPMGLLHSKFHQIHITLPSGKEIFRCDWAELRDSRRPRDNRYDLLIQGASFLVDEQDNREYAQLGRRDYAGLGVRVLRLHAASFQVRQAGLGLSISQADGEVHWLDRPRLAQADLRARQFNSHIPGEPVQATAIFSPQQGIHIQSLKLAVPSLPLAAVATEGLLGDKARSGAFQGQVEVRLAKAAPRVDIQGRLVGVELAELTPRLPGGAIQGQAELNLDRLSLLGGRVGELAGQVTLRGLKLASLAPSLGVPGLTGQANLQISKLHLAGGKLQQLEATGSFTHVDLAPLAQAAGYGSVTGQCDGLLTDLRAQGGRLTALRLLANQSGTQPCQVSKETITRLLEQVLHLPLPGGLTPSKLDCQDVNAELCIADNQLRVAGQLDPSTGERRPLASVKVLGIPVPIRGDFDRPVDLREDLSRLETQLQTLLGQIMLAEPPSIRPAAMPK